MKLPREAIEEYQKIYKEIYKKEISFEDAEKQATDFFLIMKSVYKPIRKSWIEENKPSERNPIIANQLDKKDNK